MSLGRGAQFFAAYALGIGLVVVPLSVALIFVPEDPEGVVLFVFGVVVILLPSVLIAMFLACWVADEFPEVFGIVWTALLTALLAIMIGSALRIGLTRRGLYSWAEWAALAIPGLVGGGLLRRFSHRRR